MASWVRRIFSGLAIVLANIAMMAADGRADNGPATLIIVDGSGSMWGKMEGDDTAKFYGTRDQLRALLENAPAPARIGLASFGHRRKADCSDAQVIAPIEAGGADAVATALEQLSPKGKGPLVTALREGVKAVGTGGAGTIILVHDNADNCQQDVCAAAADIAKSNPALRVHSIGLGLSKTDRERMKCLAAATGGVQFDAGTQDELGAALGETFKLAALDPASVPVAPPAAASGAAATAPSAAPTGPPGLRLTAALAEDGAMTKDPVGWRIVQTGAGADAAPLIERRAREINETLPPGTYGVEASLGLVTRSFEIDVGSDGPTVRRLPLDAGVIAIKATASRLGDKLVEPVMALRPLGAEAAAAAAENPGAKPPAAAQETPIWIGRDAAAQHVVPAGTYLVTVRDGLASATATLAVTAGATQRADLVLETGRLELSAAGFDGGPQLDRVLYLIAVDDADAPQGRREIARSTAPNPSFTLQAGTYYVTARQGLNEVRERVAISSGDIVKTTLVLGLARLTVKPVLTGVSAMPKVPIVTRISEVDGAKRTVAQSTSNDPSFMVGTGRFRIDTRVGSLNIRASRVVEVSPGKDITADLKLEAGEISVTAPGGGVAQGVVRAALRDAKGRIVWRSRTGEALKTLVAPGTYVLQVETGTGLTAHDLSVAAGDVRSVTVPGP